MNLDNLLKEMKEKMQERDLSDKYLEENRHMTRTEMGIGEYGYGITTVPCEWVYDFLSDYKRVLKINEVLLKENEELREKWDKDTHILQNELDLTNVDKTNNYIPVQKVKDKIEEIDKIYNDIPEDEGNFAKAILIKEKQVLQELLEGEK